MDKIEEASVQATHIKNSLEVVLYNLYDMKTDDLEKMNTTIAVLEAIKCLTEKRVDELERLEV